MKAEFQPTRKPHKRIQSIEKPYVKMDIWAKDHANIIYQDLTQWNCNGNKNIAMWQGTNRIALLASQSGSSLILTQTLNIAVSGYYQPILRMVQCPNTPDGTVTLKIDGNVVDVPAPTFANQFSWTRHDYGRVYLSAGNHTFEVDVTKNNSVGQLFLTHVVEYSTHNKSSDTQLNPITATFTQNTVNDYNTCKVDFAMKQSYYTPASNIWSKLVFDITDSMTLYVGKDKKTAKAMFGGYVMDRTVSDDGQTLHLEFIDRMLDLAREPVYKNFAIGVAPQNNANPTFPYVRFSSGVEAVRYLTQIIENSILPFGIDYPNAFYLNFTDINQFNSVSVQGFTKAWDWKRGNPAPCLQLGIDQIQLNDCGGVSNPQISCVLWSTEDTLADATIYPYLKFDYICPSGSVNYPLQFDVGISMYKAGQDPSQAVEYCIKFTGKAGQNNTIGSVTPTLNGQKQQFKINIKTLFDQYANSTNYYITQIRLFNTLTASEVTNRSKSLMYLDNVMLDDETVQIKYEIDQDTSLPFDILKAVCAEINYVAFFDYADDRRNDVMWLAPVEYGPAGIEAVEGVNIVSVTNEQYAPMDYIANRVLKHYHYTDTKNNQHTGVSYVEDLDSIIHYGPWQKYEDLSNVSTQDEADRLSKIQLDNSAYPYVSFSMILEGTTLLDPSCYIVVTLNSRALSGNQNIAAITHTIKWDDASQNTTQIDIGRPSDEYRIIMDSLQLDFNKQANRNNSSEYNNQSMKRLGFSSVGGFVRSGSQYVS